MKYKIKLKNRKQMGKKSNKFQEEILPWIVYTGEVNHTWGVIAVTAIQLLQSGLMTRALKERCQNTMQCLKEENQEDKP